MLLVNVAFAPVSVNVLVKVNALDPEMVELAVRATGLAIDMPAVLDWRVPPPRVRRAVVSAPRLALAAITVGPADGVAGPVNVWATGSTSAPVPVLVKPPVPAIGLLMVRLPVAAALLNVTPPLIVMLYGTVRAA